MNKRGFVLLDALVGVFIVCTISTITINIFFNYQKYQAGYTNYQEEINERYKEIFENQGECVRCIIEEIKDSSPLEQY